ncbi:alpha/beta hydrolase family protein [Nonomuraea sediminis]|uniref:alpha/beta hydrolase family protein n=1 Tax=Nonomuraea sediminis TaxID=2835864 RepID=UPI001BDC8A08|nr:prolyl oligopeptidase family serine peptidase [Nonomuraea sediminis]
MLHGTVVAPAGAGRRPGMVLVAGAGARGRNAYRPEAEAFARAGIVVLIYDKRPGYTRATSSFTDLADDAVAGVRLLRTRPDVDPGKVGVWGHSEGGWVAPLAASRSPEVSFVVPVAASALHTDRAQLWSNRVYLTHYGVKQSLQPPIGMNLSRMLVSAGLFGDVANDPIATLEKVRQPLLAVFAEHDRSTAPGESMTLFRQALDRAHNTHYTLRVIPQADHNLHQSTTGFGPQTPTFAPGYVDTITRWVTHLPPSKPTSDAPPTQPLTSEPLHPLSWYESIPLHLTLLAVILTAFLAYPTGALARTIRARLRRSPAPYPAPPATHHLARLTVITGTTTVLGTITYLLWIVATGATTVGPTILGRPPLWLLLQLLAVTTIAAGTTLTLRRSPMRVRQALLTTATAAFIPWSAYWGLLTP